MQEPDQRLFEHDLQSPEFLIGATRGRWGLVEEALLPAKAAWPNLFLWIAAAMRRDSPTRFCVALDGSGYRSVPPTGTFWDSNTKELLEAKLRPKGKPGSRFEKVFRTDWENGKAFYHPYDRVAAESHPAWKTEQPNLIWTNSHTIVDYLMEFHSLLNCGDYVGV